MIFHCEGVRRKDTSESPDNEVAEGEACTFTVAYIISLHHKHLTSTDLGNHATLGAYRAFGMPNSPTRSVSRHREPGLAMFPCVSW